MSLKTFLIASLAAVGMTAPVANPQFGGFSLGGSTKNDAVNGACKPYTLIFARGTTEGGNMGQTVGPALSPAIGKLVGSDKLATQGTDYPADFTGTFIGS